MIHKPEISVILSTYNRNRPQDTCPSLFERALQSILNQSFTNFELILIDDASTDGTLELCHKYAQEDSRIQFIPHQKNTQLPAKCYNEGMQKSSGKFIAFMFDDDVWLPNALADLYNFFTSQLMLDPDLGMVYGLAEFYDVKNNVTIDSHFGRDWDLGFLFQHNYIANCCVMLRKEVVDTVGGYDEHPLLRRVCDWDLWQRIGRKYAVKRMTLVVAQVYQNHSDSLGILFTWEPTKASLYRFLRYKYPLKVKITPFTQRLNYIKSFFTIYVLCAFTNLMRKLFKTIGCLEMAKKLYRKVFAS